MLAIYNAASEGVNKIMIFSYELRSIRFSTLFDSSSKSKTSNFVISVPFRDPTAHTSFDSDAFIRQTTPPFRRESKKS